ncbi:MAG: chemotaxis protein [Xanthobacteraceae bacterium]|nr:chemotaxis protein [Xanthobacteraceae bacterium]
MNNAWAKDAKGNIVIFPLVGYETMIVENRALALRLPFMIQGDQQSSPSGNVQLIISNASDARQFAEDILAAVEKIEQAQA